MLKFKSLSHLPLALTLAGTLLFPALAHATTVVNGANWNTFYDSLDVMASELSVDEIAMLNEDVNAIDQYYFGQYADGVYTQLGDLKFKESLSGLNAKQIHKLALKLSKKEQ